MSDEAEGGEGTTVELTEVVAAERSASPASPESKADDAVGADASGIGGDGGGGGGGDVEEGRPDALPLEPTNGSLKMTTAEIQTPSHFRRAGNQLTTLEWKDIKFSVTERGKKKEILRGVSGVCAPGQMVALMGPSGAGKTSLLNILACRTVASRRTEVTGTIRVNGEDVDRRTFRKSVAYVMQQDVMYAYQTPREVLRFSAKLRLPDDRTVEERNDLVDWMLSTLGLEACADTRIGSIKVAGISGGERKRTAIGVELITAPRILFLDEPTSGLDSFGAFNVVKVLNELSAQGTTIIATIHQPSSETYELFQNTHLLAKGNTIFNGRTENILPYFAALGHPCPAQYNPADFILMVTQKADDDELATLVETWQTEEKQNPAVALQAAEAAQLVEGARGEEMDRPPPNCCVQLGWLSQRAFTNFGRDTSSIIARIGITVIQNLLVSLVFLGVGRGYTQIEPTNFTDPGDVVRTAQELNQILNAHFGILFFVAIGALFGLAQPLLLTFPTERPIFLRENAVGTYSPVAYFISQMFVEIPVGIIQMIIVYLVSFWTVGMAGNFFYLVLTTALVGFVSAATAILIGAFASSVETAMQAAPLTFVPQILFAGFFIPVSLIPNWLSWAQYLCALKYGVNILLIVEFGLEIPAAVRDGPVTDEQYYLAVFGCPTATSECDNRLESALFPRNQIDVNSAGIYVGIMFGIFALFRIIAAIVLTIRSQSST